MSLRPLRIVLVEFSPSGGLFQFSFEMGTALAQAGHTVTLLTGPDPEFTSTVAGFDVAPVLPTWHPGAGVEPSLVRKARRGVRALRHVAAWASVARFVRETRPDVLQWSEWRFALDGLLASAVASRRWAGICADLAHSPIPLEEQRGGSGPYRQGRLLYRGLGRGYLAMDAVMVLGSRSRAELLDAWPEVQRVEVIPHGDLRTLAHDEPAAAGDCPERVVLFGALTGYKGIDVLLEAFTRIRSARPSATLLIAGPVVGDLNVAEMQMRAAAVEGVEFSPGYVPADDVARLVGGARLVAAPYTRSNSSGVVRLAQTLARPVVATDVGDLSGSVKDGETGLVVRPGDPEGLAEAVIRLLGDPRLATRMGAEGRRQLFAESSWELAAGRLVSIYRSALDITAEGRLSSIPSADPAAIRTSGPGHRVGAPPAPPA